MAKVKAPNKAKAEFEIYVQRSSDAMLETMLEILDMQMEHPDYMNRCWSGSSHNVPIMEVVTVLNAEKKRRAGRG